MMKTTFKVFCAVSAVAYGGVSLAYDSGPALLGSAIGSTDYYKITCAAGAAGDTDHLNLKLQELGTVAQDAPVLNVRVDGPNSVQSAQETLVTPGSTRQISVAGGNGKYRVTLDTAGSPAAFTAKQRFTLGFSCLNAEGQKTRASVGKRGGRIKPGQQKGVTVSCKKNKRAGDTDQLLVSLTNSTQASGGSSKFLNAQLLQDPSAANLTNGQEANFRGINARNGNGSYYLTVNDTGTGADNSSQYQFLARCVDAANADVGEPVVEQLQDQ